MLKTIPKSSINRRSFNVHKKWTVTNSDHEVLSASLEPGAFDNETFTSQNGIITHSLYSSIKSKYYQNQDNIFNLFGSTDNIANISNTRTISDTIYVIPIPQNKFGEKIKEGSVEFNDLDNDVTYADSKGQIVSTTPLYTLVSIDLSDSSIVIKDNDNEEFTGTITSMDFSTGVTVLTFGSDTDSVVLTRIDFENNTLLAAEPLDFDGLEIDQLAYGNIFYSDGLLVFTNLSSLRQYRCSFRSTKTIHETEILISSKAGEFNYSQNPSAVEVTLTDSYDFTTTEITNVSPANTKKIKEVQDIKRKETFGGSTGSVEGTWNDYFVSASTDPTGSYLTTYITTIGIYDVDGDMVAVAKLPQPIKNLPDYDVNFIVRFDT